MKSPLLLPLLVSTLFLAHLSACSGPDSPEDQQENQENQHNQDNQNENQAPGIELPDDGCSYGPATELVELGAFRVFVDAESGRWWVRTETNGPVVEAPGSCPGLAEAPLARFSRDEPDHEFAFGAFKIDTRSERNALPWRPLQATAASVSLSDDEVRLSWTVADAEQALVFSLFEGRDLSIRVESTDQDIIGELNLSCRADEAFFGLGTQVTGMNLLGRTYPLWTQEQGNGKNDDPFWPLENTLEAAYAPMGVWHSSWGYSAILGHDGYHEVDLCDADTSLLRLRSYPDPPEVILVAGDSPKDRMTALTDYTGRLQNAPDWVFGPWNDAVSGPERVANVAEHLRQNGIPSSAMWTEDWIGGELTPNGFRLSYRWAWDPDTYPDLPELIADLQQAGFAFLAYFNPFVPTTVPRYPEAVDEGHLIRDEDGEVYLFGDPAFRSASLVDLTSPAARDWTYGYMHRAVTELNIDGWMLDFAEWLPIDAVLHSGESPWRMHNLYPTLWQEVSRDALQAARPDGNWTYFARSGWASARGGTPGIAPTLWGGDQNTDWTYEDGLPSIVPIGAHAGMAGVAIFGSDIAGYSSLFKDNTDKELFLRWAAIGTFHPLMRTHHGGDKCGNWMYDSDEETLEAYRRFARIHTLLLPYFRLLRDDAMERGWPMIRHPYLVEGNRGRLWEAPDYQFFLGDDLLVAPILQQGITSRSVTLPDGLWWPLFGDAPMEVGAGGAGDSVEVDASVAEIPVFARGGKAIPLLGRWVDSFYGSDNPLVTDLSDVAGHYRVALYPDATGAVADTTVGDAVVSAQGLPQRPDWTTATVDGQTLPPCDEVPTAPCSRPEALFLHTAEAEVQLDTARVQISGTSAQHLRLGVAAQAWGGLAEAPAITDLDPPFVSYCEVLGIED